MPRSGGCAALVVQVLSGSAVVHDGFSAVDGM
jgi:hypothetical protein